ncbi:glycosyltransferase family 4 protein, partial [Candidatus Gracilibacteria bacterium]|nr:glycosyltransferase family 4 protein [Candidatus Gracilibacteria bacterium]
MKIGIDARMFSDGFTGIGRYNFELTKRLFENKEIKGEPVEWVIFLNEP